MRAYTVTLRIGYWIGHVLRIGSPQFIAGLAPGPALREYALTIWPAQDEQRWPPPKDLSDVGGLIALARSIDGELTVT